MSKSSFFTNSGSAQTTQLAFAEANDSILAALSRAEAAAATAASSATTLSGSEATVTGLINGFSADLSAAESANATALAQQATLTTAQNQLTTDLATVTTKVTDATNLANSALDSGFTLSTDPVGASSRYSALHYASKAETAKGEAETAKTDAETAKTGAETAQGLAERAKADAQKFASNAADTLFTLSDNVTTGYSALHYNSLAQAAKTDAENAKADAAKIASHTEGSQFTLSDSTTGYSALHYQDLAQKFAVNATSFDLDGATYQSALTSANIAKDFAESNSIFTIDDVQHVSAKQWAVADSDITIGDTTYKSAKSYAEDTATANTALNGRLDEFALVYQGAFTSQPTARNDGSALQEKDLYYDLTGNTLLIYKGSSWVEFFDHPTVIKDTFTYEYEAGAGPHTFQGDDIANRPLYIGTSDLVEVHINGQKERTTGFTVDRVNNSVTILGTLPQNTNNDVVITVYKAFALTDAIAATGGTFSGAVTFNAATTHTAGKIFDFSDANGLTIEHPMMSLKTNGTTQGMIGLQRVWDSTLNSFESSVFVESRDGSTKTAGLSFEADNILPRYDGAADSQKRVNFGSSTNYFKLGYIDSLNSSNLTSTNGTIGTLNVTSFNVNNRRRDEESFFLKGLDSQTSGQQLYSFVPNGTHGLIAISTDLNANLNCLLHHTNAISSTPGVINILAGGAGVTVADTMTTNYMTPPTAESGTIGQLNLYYRYDSSTSQAKIYLVNRTYSDLNFVVTFL